MQQVLPASGTKSVEGAAGGADIGFDVCVPSFALRHLGLECSRQRRALGARGLPMVVFSVGQSPGRSWRMAIWR
jgi:hypothetical protein